jgi:hypothetical protein
MADVFQGNPLPAITTTTQAQTTAPEFYTNYLQDIANLGQAGVQMGGVAGMSPLQQQALAMAPQAAFSGMGTMGTGADLATHAGTTTAPQMINQYMNPYTQNVVNEMARLQQRQIKENLLPSMQGAAGSMGGFGSSRQFNATGNMLRDLQSDLLGKQYGALSQGYTEAMKGAQTDLGRELQAGDTLGGLGQRQQQAATTGLGTLSTLGGQEQALAQRQLDYPMTAAQNYSKLMQGYQIPTGETKQVTGSQGYSTSPLAQVTGLLAALGSFINPSSTSATKTTNTTNNTTSGDTTGGLTFDQVTGGGGGGGVDWISSNPDISGVINDGGFMFSDGGEVSAGAGIPVGAEYHDGQGNFYDASGNLVR